MSCTTSYTPVLDRALASWRRLADTLPAELLIDRYDSAPSTDKLFKTSFWYACLLRKCKYFLARMQLYADAEEDEVMIFSDADIQVFPALGEAWPELVQDMLDRDLDCLFMRENSSAEVNGGLLVARVTNRMLAFWEQVVAAFVEDPTVELGEQTLINRLLYSSGLHWDFLGSQHVVWATLLPCTLSGLQSLGFHHAVCADGIEAKGVQMDRVATRVLEAQRARLSRSPRQNTRAHIVLCRYNEGRDCLDHWLGHDGCEVFLYDRGPQPLQGVPPEVQHRLCGNVGREGHVYLSHIVEHYDRLPEVLVCSQCNGIDGPRQLPVDTLLRVNNFRASVFNVGQGFLLATRWTEREGQGLGYIEYPRNSRWWRAWQSGSMARARMSMGEFYARYIDECLPPSGRCVTTFTGSFSVGRDAVSSHPVTFYAKLQGLLGGSADPEEGHYLERAWAHVFLGPHAALCVRDKTILN